MSTEKGLTRAQKISIVGMIGVFCLSVVGIALWMGLLTGLLVAAAVTLVLTLLLVTLIKAKSSETEIKKWIIVEVLVGVIYLPIVFGVVIINSRAVTVFNNRSEIFSYMASDINTVEGYIEAFENETRNGVETLKMKLNNSKGHRDQQLQKIINEKIGYSTNQYESLIQEKIRLCCARDEDVNNRGGYNRIINDAKLVVQRNDLLKLRSSLEELNQLKDLDRKLKAFAGTYDILQIEKHQNSKNYYLRSQQLSINIDHKLLLTLGKLSSSKYFFSLSGLAIAIILQILVLTPYFVTPRSRRISIKKSDSGDDDGSVVL